jgi:GAF domain-containing protein
MHRAPTLPDTNDRAKIFAALAPQVDALLREEKDPIAAMANLSSAIKEAFQWHWVGFYRVQGMELILGPFQGPVACTRIGYGQGVCGTAWKEDRTIVVPDVELFPGHIACSPLSRSEVVVPVHGMHGEVVAVLDIDSSTVNDLSSEDAHGIEALVKILEAVY